VNDLPSLDRPEPTPPKIRALVMLEGEERLVLRPLENASPADGPVIASIALEQAIMGPCHVGGGLAVTDL
jgi:hypothetical protein